MEDLDRIRDEVVACRACPRLVEWRERAAREKVARFSGETYWGRPVPGFGDPMARILVLGLAPAAHGGNRTGRIFTGDKTAEFLFAALHEAGLSNLPASLHKKDGLKLTDLYLTPALKCAPPQDKPLPDELKRCAPFLKEELEQLKSVRVVLALGKIAHDAYLRFRGLKLSAHPFAHAAVHDLGGGPLLVDTYHCSPRNTNTGLLTPGMLRDVLALAIGKASGS